MTSRSQARREGIAFWPLLLFLLALGLRLVLLARGPWDGLYGQDAFAYWWQAEAIAALAPSTDFFWPSGFPALVAPLIWLFGPNPSLALAVSVLAGALLPVLVYTLAHELLPEEPLAAVVAGLLMVASGQVLLSSLTVMADVPALAWGVLGLRLALRGGGKFSAPTLAMAAGVALSMAIVTRWLMALLLPALLLYIVTARRPVSRQQGAALAVGLLVPLLPQLWLTSHRPDSVAHHLLLQWHPANSIRRVFDTAEGIQRFELPPLLFNLYPAVHPTYLLPPLGLLALLGLWVLWRWRQWPALVLLLGWAGLGYLLLAGLPYENFRYGLLLVAPIMILCGSGAAWLWQRLAARHTMMALLFLLLWLGMAGWGVRQSTAFIDLHNGMKAWVAQAEAQLPANAALLTFGMSQIARQYSAVEVYNLHLEDERSLAAHRAADAPLYLFVDVAQLESQWAGLAPEAAYRYLAEEDALVPVDRLGPLTLFEVR